MKWIATPLVLVALVVAIDAEELRGKVVRISDGDTITVLDGANVQHKVRLDGIDAPESGQAFGTKSKEALGDKIAGKQIVVKWEKKDRYDRIVGDVWLGDRHINLEMVREGMAWHYKQYSKSKELAEAEIAARRAKKGLWADKAPMPPWDYRKLNK